MKFKLITDGNNNYSVLDSKNELIATTMESIVTNQKLSLKNCEAIANGYDLDELAENEVRYMRRGDERLQRWYGFVDGFEKALEILGDKKFSEEQMLQAFLKGVSLQIDAPTFQQSLQQKEWEVEIEMETIWVGQCNCPCHSDGVTIMHFMACCHPRMVESPKLDSDGCLILKRK